MKIPEAIQVLRNHQAWRLGAECSQTNPKRLTEAIYVILEKVEQISAIDWDEIQIKFYKDFPPAITRTRQRDYDIFEWFKKEIKQRLTN